MIAADATSTTVQPDDIQRPMLEVRDLDTQFFTRKGVARVLEKSRSISAKAKSSDWWARADPEERHRVFDRQPAQSSGQDRFG